MEEKQQVKTYEIRYKCDSCKDGYLIYNGQIDKMPGFTRYQHSCSNKKCVALKYLDSKYPHFTYEDGTPAGDNQNNHLDNHIKNQEKPKFQPNTGNGYQPKNGKKGSPPKKR